MINRADVAGSEPWWGVQTEGGDIYEDSVGLSWWFRAVHQPIICL